MNEMSKLKFACPQCEGEGIIEMVNQHAEVEVEENGTITTHYYKPKYVCSTCHFVIPVNSRVALQAWLVSQFRGTGRTTRQMQAAPKYAYYVWYCADLSYPRYLAHTIGCDNLRIGPPSFVSMERLRGIRRNMIVIDHDTELTAEQWDTLRTMH